MKKGKHKSEKNKNVLVRLERAVNQYANPHFNKKSKNHNFDKNILDEKQKKNKFKSKLEQTDAISEFKDLASLTNKNYNAISEEDAMKDINSLSIVPLNQSSNILIQNTLQNSSLSLSSCPQFLSIPKRPKYSPGTSKEAYKILETTSFLSWRKHLAELEFQNLSKVITPFEKNIEVWRQLWITVDKSQLLFQIVDARNPLFFRCPDLEEYVKGEGNGEKKYFLILNKADLISEDMRRVWKEYFEEIGVQIVFFSAVEEMGKLREDTELKDNERKNDLENTDLNEQIKENCEGDTKDTNNRIKTDIIGDSETNNASENNKNESKDNEIRINKTNISSNLNKIDNSSIKVNNSKLNNKEGNSNMTLNSTKIYTRLEFIKFIQSQCENLPKISNKEIKFNIIGFIGYPNVGKSSIINVLMKNKKVGVAAMPGKTKHYQTIFLPPEERLTLGEKSICLMDCPGLVFPSFTSSKSEMFVHFISL